MIRFAFRRGLRFIREQCGWTINKRLVNGQLQLESDDGVIENMTPSALHIRWLRREFYIDQEDLASGKANFYFTAPADLQTLSKNVRDEALRRFGYVKRCVEWFESLGSRFIESPDKLLPIIAEVAKENNELPPYPRTVARWYHQWLPTKSVMKLAPRRTVAGRRVDDLQRSLFFEAVDEVFLTSQKNPKKEVIRSLKLKIGFMNRGMIPGEKPIVCPSVATIYRWFDVLDAKFVHLKRSGKTANEQQYRKALKQVRCSNILERIEIDHSPIDCFVIDSLTKLALGRPWITVALDRYSRAILGFYISFRTPSSYSVLMCLRQAMFPKDAILERFGIRGEWPCFGIPKLVATDNGMDLHSDAVEAICCEMGIEILFCGAGKPQHKGAIERVIGTAQRDLFHTLPGTTFQNVDDRGDYPSEDVAALDMETLTHLVVEWITNTYMQTPHRGQGMHGATPSQKWTENAALTVIELPAFQEQLDVLVGLPEKRVLFHYGLEVDCLRYNSHELQRIRARHVKNPTLSLKLYEHDISYIDVFDVQINEYLRVPVIDTEYAQGLNRHMHRIIRAHSKTKYGDVSLIEKRDVSKREMQELVAAAMLDKKLAMRKMAARLSMHDSAAAIHDPADLSQSFDAATQPPIIPKPSTDGAEDPVPEDDALSEDGFQVETMEDA